MGRPIPMGADFESDVATLKSRPAEPLTAERAHPAPPARRWDHPAGRGAGTERWGGNELLPIAPPDAPGTPRRSHLTDVQLHHLLVWRSGDERTKSHVPRPSISADYRATGGVQGQLSEPSYNGAATIVVDGRRFDVHVRLSRDAELQKVERPDGRGGTIERPVSWVGSSTASARRTCGASQRSGRSSCDW